jgi:hypothetical protein
MRLLEFVVTRFASAIVEHGIDEAEARAEAEQFESAIRATRPTPASPTIKSPDHGAMASWQQDDPWLQGAG